MRHLRRRADVVAPGFDEHKTCRTPADTAAPVIFGLEDAARCGHRRADTGRSGHSDRPTHPAMSGAGNGH